MKKEEILESLKKLHKEHDRLYEKEDVLIGILGNAIQVKPDIFVLLTEGQEVEAYWNDNHLRLHSQFDEFSIVTLLSPRLIGEDHEKRA